MIPTHAALIGYVAWTLAMVMTLALTRTAIALRTGRSAANFNPSGEDLPGFPQRATRVYLNCTENLPAAAALLLFAIATQQTAATDALALPLLGARILQSATHLVSANRVAVIIRFAFYLAQLGILVWWLIRFAFAI